MLRAIKSGITTAITSLTIARDLVIDMITEEEAANTYKQDCPVCDSSMDLVAMDDNGPLEWSCSSCRTNRSLGDAPPRSL